MEKYLILVAEIGGAVGVFGGIFSYLFKNHFREMAEPLSKAIDGLANNVSEMTRTLSSHQVKLDQLETRVDSHETRIVVIEHDHITGGKHDKTE